MNWSQHQRLYGALDPLSVLPFVEHYGIDRLSPHDRRLARVLDKAMRGESPLGRTVCFTLTMGAMTWRCIGSI